MKPFPCKLQNKSLGVFLLDFLPFLSLFGCTHTKKEEKKRRRKRRGKKDKKEEKEKEKKKKKLLLFSSASDILIIQAPYYDPRTTLRYANADVFKVIRSLPNEYVQRYLAMRNAAVILR